MENTFAKIHNLVRSFFAESGKNLNPPKTRAPDYTETTYTIFRNLSLPRVFLKSNIVPI